jgi:hypothetical protein
LPENRYKKSIEVRRALLDFVRLSKELVGTMEDQAVRVRVYVDEDAKSLGELLAAHMETDDTWPPRHARIQHNLTDWLADSSRLGRWVALLNSSVVGHVGVDSVAEGNKADHWMRELDLPRSRLAEIGRLVVHPEKLRSRLSELLTRRAALAQAQSPNAHISD